MTSSVARGSLQDRGNGNGTRIGSDGSGARVSWDRVLRSTGSAEAIALLGVAAVLADVEAAAIGAGFVVAVALLRVRTGLLGRVAIGLLSANVAVWMILGTVSNLVNGDGLGALVVPATLAALAVIGLVSAVAATLRRHTGGRSVAPLRFVGAVAVLLVIILLAGAVTASAGTRARPGDLGIGAEQLRFTETELRAPAGEVGIVVANGDLFWHTFTIDALGVDLPVPVQASRRVTFTAEPGTYEYYCRIPGHEALMAGTLIVE